MITALTSRQKELLRIIYQYIRDTGYPPSFEEMRIGLEVGSNQSIFDLISKLEQHKLIRKKEGSARGLVILPLGYEVLGENHLTPFLGTTTAGLPISPIEIQGEWKSVSGELDRLEGEVFLLKVKGDSMINAGINDGATVLVKTAKEFFSGEIVLADIAGESTIKRFISEDKPPYLYLKPENPKYNIIYFSDEVSLRGKVVSIINGGQMPALI